MRQNPKNIVKSIRWNGQAVGGERRYELCSQVMKGDAHFPKTLLYEDIDREVYKWVDESFSLVYDGRKFNTYKLFSNQRMTEYGQTWKNLDDKGNLDINFKTVTREPNPQKGEITGGNYNIPGDISFPIFKTRSFDGNGVEYTEVYSMKQPVPVNLIYTIGVFTNTYKILNEMNSAVQTEFSSLERYIFPNGFAVPMELSSVSDESDYTIDDRKYYSQTYQIKVMAFIIQESDYTVTKVPSRVRLQFASGINSCRKKTKKKFDIQQMTLGVPGYNTDSCGSVVEIESASTSGTVEEIMTTPVRTEEIEIEELCGLQKCWEGTEDEISVGRKIVYTIPLDYCSQSKEFVSDYRMGLEGIDLTNVKSYKLYVDGVEMKVEDSDVEVLKGDSVRIEVNVRNEKEQAYVRMVFYDLDSMV